uniref:Uncharacterized protein n=1 Tax=Arundo donax TaxID=35708 RepID=A0A0A9AIN1_ARUDO
MSKFKKTTSILMSVAKNYNFYSLLQKPTTILTSCCEKLQTTTFSFANNMGPLISL